MLARVARVLVRALAIATILIFPLAGPAQADTLSSVTITANGQGEFLQIGSNSSLQIAIAADGGTLGFHNPSDLYLGVVASSGVSYFTPTGLAINPPNPVP